MKYCMLCGNWLPDDADACETCGQIYKGKHFDLLCNDGYIINLTNEQMGEIFDQMKQYEEHPITLSTDEII